MSNNQTKITKVNLEVKFREEYEEKNGKFLLFNLANANENANTKVLKYLLQYNNHQFLASFLQRIGISIQPTDPLASFLQIIGISIQPTDPITITDQKQAIGTNGTGFIDLYIHFDKIHIIIENKIYGAADTDKQLARYIATVNGINAKDFDNWYDTNSTKYENTHVVYLTADGTKEPSEDSLPVRIRERVKYYSISYSDVILPWLEEDVMPKIPFLEDGMMIYGMRQYIAFLKHLLTKEESEVVNVFIDGLKNEMDKEKYNKILEAIKAIKNKDDIVLQSLRKDLGYKAEAIFSGDLDGEVGGWVLHFTPSFVLLYKKSWAELDTRKYSIPSLSLVCATTDNFLNNGFFNTISVEINHLSGIDTTNFSEFKFVNHGKTASKQLDINSIEPLKDDDVNHQNNRKDYYKAIIGQDNVAKAIKAMDNAVIKIKGKLPLDNLQSALLGELQTFFTNNQ